MAIIIQNVSKNASPFGVHQYELRINHKLIARFEHKREEGLAVCLKKAADAAEKAKWLEAAALLGVLEPKDIDRLT